MHPQACVHSGNLPEAGSWPISLAPLAIANTMLILNREYLVFHPLRATLLAVITLLCATLQHLMPLILPSGLKSSDCVSS